MKMKNDKHKHKGKTNENTEKGEQRKLKWNHRRPQNDYNRLDNIT